MSGQIPLYYGRKNTGRPATPESIMYIDDIPPRAPQISFGLTSYHLDAGDRPLFPFGHGLSYTTFRYDNIRCSAREIAAGESIVISAELTNTGDVEAEEVTQLYVRDLVGNVTRPVRELKGFQRHRLRPGERVTVAFTLHSDDLAFWNRNMQRVTEPGDFHAWIGGNSDAGLWTEFSILALP
jgi:beta-glucosidase